MKNKITVLVLLILTSSICYSQDVSNSIFEKKFPSDNDKSNFLYYTKFQRVFIKAIKFKDVNYIKEFFPKKVDVILFGEKAPSEEELLKEFSRGFYNMISDKNFEWGLINPNFDDFNLKTIKTHKKTNLTEIKGEVNLNYTKNNKVNEKTLNFKLGVINRGFILLEFM